MEVNMQKERLFLKMTRTEHNILNVAKQQMHASSYREVIVTLLDGEYIDYLCSSVLTEKALRKIIVNLNQLSKALERTSAFTELRTLVDKTTALISEWNTLRLQPVFSHREVTREIQVRVSTDEKETAYAAKTAAGFRTYCDLVMHLCCAYISGRFELPEAPDYTLFNYVGKSLNEEAKWYNTNKTINPGTLNNIFDSLYELTSDLYEKISRQGGHHVS